MKAMKVITTENVYTHRIMDLCQDHYDAEANGHAQVQHGLHAGMCDACAAETTPTTAGMGRKIEA